MRVSKIPHDQIALCQIDNTSSHRRAGYDGLGAPTPQTFKQDAILVRQGTLDCALVIPSIELGTFGNE